MKRKKGSVQNTDWRKRKKWDHPVYKEKFMQNFIYAINGPVVKVKDTKDFSMLEMVYVGHKRLIGEVIGIT